MSNDNDKNDRSETHRDDTDRSILSETRRDDVSRIRTARIREVQSSFGVVVDSDMGCHPQQLVITC